MILIPTMGMILIASASSVRRWSQHQMAASISADARRMDELMTTRNVVGNESVRARALASAAELGVAPDQLVPLYGIDFAAELIEARAALDADLLIHAEPSLQDELVTVLAERSAIDSGTLSSADVDRTFDAMAEAVDVLWRSTRHHLDDTIDGGSVDGPVLRAAEVLRASYAAFTAGRMRIRIAIELGRGGPSASVRDLIEADVQLAVATAAFERGLGVTGTEANQLFHTDHAVSRFDRVVQVLIREGLAGRSSPLETDGLAFGAAFVDTAAWMDGSSRNVVAASADLGAVATAASADRRGEFWYVMTIAGLALVISLVAVVLFSRTFTRPLDRIATVVQAVRDGAFDIPRVLLHGPRELSDTVDAVNDMAASIDQSSHDDITGLLNRRAALDAVGRDMARARRDGERVVAIFLDLDGLKGINDVHGHQAGDRALALVADALRQTCRESDVVARLGGDEFLVAGAVRGTAAVDTAYADRIREAVGQQVLWCDDVPIPLRCSVGVALNDPGSIDVDALLASADSAMYLMKVAGRAI